MSSHDKLFNELNSRKFNTEELRFLLEKFNVYTTSSSRKKELANSLADVLLGKSPFSPNRHRRSKEDRENYRKSLLLFASKPTQKLHQYIPDANLEVEGWNVNYSGTDYSYLKDALIIPATDLVNNIEDGTKGLNEPYTYSVTIKGKIYKITLHAQTNGTFNGLPSYAIYIDSSDPLLGYARCSEIPNLTCYFEPSEPSETYETISLGPIQISNFPPPSSSTFPKSQR